VSTEPQNILCISRYFKAEPFLIRAAERGARVYLLTSADLLEKPWPRAHLADVFAVHKDATDQDIVHTVAYLARNIRFDHIVGLDDFDVEVAAKLREHMRIGGMGDTTARHFRDKLAMRAKARDAGLPVPEFIGVFNHDALRDFMQRVPGPWMLKPRAEASATGITKIHAEAELWPLLEKLGDKQSYFLLEAFVPGDVFHVDALTENREVVFAAVHRCGTPPFNVAHGGGIFTTATIPYGSPEEAELLAFNQKLLSAFGLVRGASHTEFIQSRETGQFYFLETSARVGGAHIAELCEATTGLNLWSEWADLELSRGAPAYVPPPRRFDYGAVMISLARQEHPDLAPYDDPEVVYRAPESHHAGLILRSERHERVAELVSAYSERFMHDFFATLPISDKPSH